MKLGLKHKINDFHSINLSELNSQASFLKRKDRKYLLTEKQFSKLFQSLENDFKVLEIDGKRVFSYDNVYMDTLDYHFYNQHENKNELRTKVRTRLYEDSKLAFFEFKQKENGVTKKYRYEFPFLEHGTMTRGKKRFFDWVYQSNYNVPAPAILPAIRTRYNRITLVSNSSEERLTIDFNIKVKDVRNVKSKEKQLKNLVIVESKSMSKKSLSMKLMKSFGYKQASGCSKYSLWVVYSGLAKKWDTFQDTINRIKDIRLELINSRKRVASITNIESSVDNNFVPIVANEQAVINEIIK